MHPSVPHWLMLHGFLGGPQSWEGVQLALPPSLRRRARALQLPGHGSTRRTQRVPHRFMHAAQRLWEQVGFGGPVYLCGYSLGGRLAVAMALSRPKRVLGLILVGTHLGIAAPDARASRRALDRRWAILLRQQGMAAFLTQWRAQPLFASQSELDGAVLQQQGAVALGHAPAALARAIERMTPGAMPNFASRIGSLGCPILWLAGAQDAKYSQEAVRASRLCRRGHHNILASCGHNLLLEAPDQVAYAMQTLHEGARA